MLKLLVASAYATVAPLVAWALLYTAMAAPQEHYRRIGLVLTMSAGVHGFSVVLLRRYGVGRAASCLLPLVIPFLFMLSMFHPSFLIDGFLVYAAWVALWATSSVIAWSWDTQVRKNRSTSG